MMDYDKMINANKEKMESQKTGQKEKAKTASTTKRRGRPEAEQERVAFTTRVRADVRTRINVAAAQHNVRPSDVIDALTDQYMDALDWDSVGINRK